MIILCQLNFIFLHENFKKQEKILALTSFYCPSQERWLGDSSKLICIGQSRFYIFLHAGGLKKKDGVTSIIELFQVCFLV